MEREKVLQLNTSTLAYVGDAAYELTIRQYLAENRRFDASKLHHEAIAFVSSTGQALIAKTFLAEGILTEEEEKLLKRARNHRTTSRPRNADPKEYKLATGFEALMGFLYLAGEEERLELLGEKAIDIIKESKKR